MVGKKESQITTYDEQHLKPSIAKLLHYLAVYVKLDTIIEISTTADRKNIVYRDEFRAPSSIVASYTLYNRIDSCHGAGNCCRVPFALIYTDYCRNRIVNFDYNLAINQFGRESADIFISNQTVLLDRLVKLYVKITQYYDGDVDCSWFTNLWIQRNTDINPLSDCKSCPYLRIGEDRYWCSVHAFKPLHCDMPHMTVRQHGDDGSVNIGRMQYGRNHNFGCPVIFTQSISGDELVPSGDGIDYFKDQYESDLYKLRWTSNAAESLGFKSGSNFAVGLDDALQKQSGTIKRLISCGLQENIELWRRND